MILVQDITLISIYNHLLSNIKDLLHSDKQFKSVLKKYFLRNASILWKNILMQILKRHN
jgi:hypothetical protein